MIDTSGHMTLIATKMSSLLLGLTALLLIIPVDLANATGYQFMFGIPQTFRNSDNVTLYISSKYATNVFVNAPSIGFTQTIKTIASESTPIRIPSNIVATAVGTSSQLVYIEADNPISVNVMVRDTSTSDGFHVGPLSVICTEFFVSSYDPITNSQFLLATKEDDTRVEISFKTNAGSIAIDGRRYSDGQTYSITLNRMQTLMIQHTQDLTGTHIVSSKPISVVSGNQCANVPKGVAACDFMIEMLLPVQLWQNEYVCAALKTRRNNRLRVLSSSNGNLVHIGTINKTLNKGEYFEYVSSENALTRIMGTSAISVMQYAESTDADHQTGDPSMITVPSLIGQDSEYFYETPTSLARHYCSITIPSDKVAGLYIDSSAVSTSDELRASTTQNGALSLIRLAVTAGKHRIWHTDPSVKFSVIVYGFDNSESYGYPLDLIAYVPSLKEVIKSSCTTTAWHVDIDMEKLRLRNPGSVATDIYFGDNSCSGQEIGNHLIFDQDIESCLTTTKSNDTEIIHTNLLVYAYHDPKFHFIIRNINWTLDVNCHIQRNQSVDSHVTYNNPTGGNQGSLNSTTSYVIQTQFFIDPNFQKEISGNPLDVKTGAHVFVKTFVQKVDWTVKMRLHSCYTVPTLNSYDARYYLINNGCEMDANTHFLSQTDHETRFVFQAFQMTGPDPRLYIKCDATLCDTSDVTSSQQCDQRAHCTQK
ncbi:uncharacterized protein LOC127837645 isoform X2 [Dreissena polymorpha]|uniref:uncharacterized protein LOC127837645 isoform X2 n=1 Tax=Dreissena polymorpha TaxID=45954 RepID=UPI002264D9E1|nr:uncharacterized protein LOC127837645 isoform X2 [Dreissena polymorpha]